MNAQGVDYWLAALNAEDPLVRVLLMHRHLRDDPSAVTCACGEGLFTVEAHAEHVAAAVRAAV